MFTKKTFESSVITLFFQWWSSFVKNYEEKKHGTSAIILAILDILGNYGL